MNDPIHNAVRIRLDSDGVWSVYLLDDFYQVGLRCMTEAAANQMADDVRALLRDICAENKVVFKAPCVKAKPPPTDP